MMNNTNRSLTTVGRIGFGLDVACGDCEMDGRFAAVFVLGTQPVLADYRFKSMGKDVFVCARCACQRNLVSDAEVASLRVAA